MIGILNSKVMDDKGIMIVRIDEKSYEVLPYVLPFLQKIEMGARVEATIKDDKITKIARIKPSTTQIKPMGFHEAEEAMEKKEAQKPETCTSPKPDALPLPELPDPFAGQVISVTIGSTISLGNYSNVHLEIVATDVETARQNFQKEVKETVALVRKVIIEAGQ